MSTWTKMNSFNFGCYSTINSSKLIQIRSGSDHKEELSTGWIQTLFNIDPKMFEFSDLRIHKSEVWIQPLWSNTSLMQNLIPEGSIYQCHGSHQLFLCSWYGTFQESWWICQRPGLETTKLTFQLGVLMNPLSPDKEVIWILMGRYQF